ncbi:TPA: nucleoside-diphosphate kinase [archaeon]|uniref:Nucleoside diphosphate kinase n=1 Tax=Candidatus Naiadarchaeum limnaeum TaxID=2756139 RepID=A0A832XJH0_9ARCH|nr:nucleoside-diphosphate kinase [Candidatus Naiadarchaeales archaeon SRR2090153.bin1042]HIK00592.1 nucleoside-diphosphate kinase [Candidatus Naiadarchaeum limnaeum]
MAKERTFVMIKPDGIRKKLIGEILHRIEKSGLKIVAGKLIKIQWQKAERLYAEHKKKRFYKGLLKFALSGPCFVAVVQGANAIKRTRALCGATDPQKAKRGTIRGDFGTKLPFNVIHASDSPKSAKREIRIFFNPREIVMR